MSPSLVVDMAAIALHRQEDRAAVHALTDAYLSLTPEERAFCQHALTEGYPANSDVLLIFADYLEDVLCKQADARRFRKMAVAPGDVLIFTLPKGTEGWNASGLHAVIGTHRIVFVHDGQTLEALSDDALRLRGLQRIPTESAPTPSSTDPASQS